MTNQKVTVVIPYSPSHTPEHMLHEAIDSAKSQSVPTEIQVVRDEDQRGPAWARNQGIDSAETRYVAFLDADDLWHQNKLQQQLHQLQQTGSGICVEARRTATENFITELFLENIVSLTSSIMIDTHQVTEKFDTRLNRWEDHLFIIECAEKHGICFCQDIVTIRKHDQGLSSEGEQEFDMLVNERKKYHSILEEKADTRLVINHGDKKIYNLLGEATREERVNGNFSESLRFALQSMSYNISVITVASILLSIFGVILPSRANSVCSSDIFLSIQYGVDILFQEGPIIFLREFFQFLRDRVQEKHINQHDN